MSADGLLLLEEIAAAEVDAVAAATAAIAVAAYSICLFVVDLCWR